VIQVFLFTGYLDRALGNVQMRLSEFIISNMEEILQEWEDFAKTIFQAVQTKTVIFRIVVA
ncbi:MAG: hypothetical protein WCR08_13735, partial [Gammaproteobacteria bacterium]